MRLCQLARARKLLFLPCFLFRSELFFCLETSLLLFCFSFPSLHFHSRCSFFTLLLYYLISLRYLVIYPFSLTRSLNIDSNGLLFYFISPFHFQQRRKLEQPRTIE